MIVSPKPNRSNSRWSRMCVLVCTLAVLPLGLASAQDYEAVGKRLKESVQKGEITQPQAEAMMATLKKETIKKHPTSDKTPAGPVKVKKDLGAAGESGKIAKKEIVKKDEPVAKSIKEKPVTPKDQNADKTAAYLMKVKKDLAAAVAAGKISKEDALRKYEATAREAKEKTAAGPVKVKKDPTKKDEPEAKDGKEKVAAPPKVKKDPGAAVEGGKIGKKDEPAPRVIKKKAPEQDQGLDKATTLPTKVKKDLGAAVGAGKVGKEDAPKKDVKKKTAATPDNDASARELKAAVQAGKLTKEEAKAKWEAIQKETAGDKGKN